MSVFSGVRINGVPLITVDSLGTTTTPGLTLQNKTAAAAGAQQYSPGFSLIGQGWKTNATAASQETEARWELRPVQGAAAPTYSLVLMGRVNGGAWVDKFNVDNAGNTTSAGEVTGTGIYVPATGAIYWTTRTVLRSNDNGSVDFLNSSGTGFSRLNLGPPGAATTSAYFQKKVTGIADNTATDVFTVTIPNANHAAAIRLMFLSSNGSTDAFESSRAASGMVVVARTTGGNAVATAATIDDAAIATVASGATHTLAYGVSAIAGAAGASNTFTIQVTIDDSGNLGSNQLVAIAELLNAEATGITIA